MITAANVKFSSGNTPSVGVASATITAGQSLYYDATAGGWKLANAITTGKQSATAVALSGATSGGYFLYAGTGTTINIGATITKGAAYFLSGANDGGIAPMADITTTWQTDTIGFGATTANMQLYFYNTGITV